MTVKVARASTGISANVINLTLPCFLTINEVRRRYRVPFICRGLGQQEQLGKQLQMSVATYNFF